MGRTPYKHRNLPEGVRSRKQKSGKTYFYLDVGGKPRKEIPLGCDFAAAIRKWAELRSPLATPDRKTFRYLAQEYSAQVIPNKAPRTQKDNLTELANLQKFFGNPDIPLDDLEPLHVQQYLEWRGKNAKVRANRERALLSHMWNFARQKGFTSGENPCRGVKGFTETGREIYVEDDVFSAVYSAANASVRDAMDVAYLTGLRPSDLVGMTQADIRNSVLHVDQRKIKSRGKGTSKLRISLTDKNGDSNALDLILQRIEERKATLKRQTTAILVNVYGQAITYSALDNAFDRAREKAIKSNPSLADEIKEFQFRDLRAKAATDKTDNESLHAASKMLGHATVKMTENYVRNRRGSKVTPTK